MPCEAQSTLKMFSLIACLLKLRFFTNRRVESRIEPTARRVETSRTLIDVIRVSREPSAVKREGASHHGGRGVLIRLQRCTD